MRFSVATLCLLLGLLVPRLVAADCARPFATPDDVLTFNLRVTRTDWNTLRLGPGMMVGCSLEFPRVRAEFKCGDDPAWIPIGAHRKRGDQRGRDTDQKPPLKLDFNYVNMGQSWPAAMGKYGYRKLSMNQGQHDEPGGILPDLLSEYMALRLLKREVPMAPNVAYARLYVHFAGENVAPEYHGLYLLIEDYDRAAIRRRFGDGADQGALYKTTSGGCRTEVFKDVDPIAGRTAYDAWNAKTPAAGWRAETAKAMNLEDLLRHEAVRDLLANFNDTLLGSHYSNFAYFDSKTTPMRYWFPWDLDDCFKGPVAVGTNPISSDFAIIPSSSALGTKTRNQSEIRPRYLETMCQLINGTMAPAKVVAEIDQVYNLTKGFVAEEAGPVWGGRNPLDETRVWWYGWEYRRMRTWYPQRVTNVRQQIEARGVRCPVGCTAGASEGCENLNCPGRRTCTGGAWTACTPVAGCIPGNFATTPTDGGMPPPPPPPPGVDAGVARDGAAGGTGGTGGTGGSAGRGGTGGSSGTAGVGGATADGGTRPAPGVEAGAGGRPAPPPGSGGAGGDEEPVPDDAAAGAGCACALGSRDDRGPGAALLLALALLVRRRRR